MKPLFPAQPEVGLTKTQINRRLTNLVDWKHFYKAHQGAAAPPPFELRQFIFAESVTKRRPYMLKRLIARLHTAERKALYSKLKLT